MFTKLNDNRWVVIFYLLLVILFFALLYNNKHINYSSIDNTRSFLN